MSRSKPTKTSPITDRNCVLTFGKYRGYSIADVIENEPQYAVWLHENLHSFELGADLLEEALNAINPNDTQTRQEFEYVTGG